MEKKKKLFSLWTWKASSEELLNQVENYHSLKITETYRGISVLYIGILMGLSLVISFFGILVSTNSVLISLILYIPALIFTYKGHRWAMITLLILWTGDKIATFIMSVNSGASPLSSIIFWLAIAPCIWNAIIVENIRRKKQPSFQVVSPEMKKGFCGNCGNRIDGNGNFCKACGNKVI